MKKIMISQPMMGLTEDKIRQNREHIVNELTNKGYEIIDTVQPDFTIEEAINIKNIPLKFIANSINFMVDADILYMMKDWQYSRGCKVEHMVAVEYGLEIMYE